MSVAASGAFVQLTAGGTGLLSSGLAADQPLAAARICSSPRFFEQAARLLSAVTQWDGCAKADPLGMSLQALFCDCTHGAQSHMSQTKRCSQQVGLIGCCCWCVRTSAPEQHGAVGEAVPCLQGSFGLAFPQEVPRGHGVQRGFGEQEVTLASGAGMSPGLCAQGGGRVQMCPPRQHQKH